MKAIGLFIMLGYVITACNQKPALDNTTHSENQKVVETETVRDGVFIHITESYNDPHKVLMPLKMANMMANDKDVIVYLDIHAVELVVKGAKDMNYADFESCQSYIKQLIDKKVGVYACPTCLKIAGFTLGDLMDGVQIAQKDKFFSFTKGKILSLDY